ncbi:hypothetical protein GSI_05636 [Ganoderma sinense ZZ0214-1]|uniref:HAT C-terminal dimerisation domain-containing protein n=1 Tax=Ganoderma sinense ZZ0214-1 TaxID=1077348 RepID=A0A2G8SF49_9APHY|nr:hypothetical protein GSI_05636 [Ganoderma sinense ZZ0214-1]
MPPAKDPPDQAGKRRRRVSDEGAEVESPSDRDDPAPIDNAPTTRATRSSARISSNKRAKAQGGGNAAADARDSSEEEETEKSDAAPNAGAAPNAASRTPSASATFSERRAARLTEKYGDLTTQESLDARAAKWTSQVYHHFRKPVLATKKDGTLTSRFVCIKNPSKHVDRALNVESTGNLNKHVKLCIPEKTTETQLITEYAQGVNYSYARLRFLLAMWVARRHRPFTIVEDPEFREILRMLFARVDIPSSKLQGLPGKIHICLDGWTSPNVISFLGVTAHWHENGKIEHIILDFIKLAKGHTGEYLAHKLMGLLEEFGIVDKVLGVTCDNASNNAKMLKEMKKLNADFRGPDARVRCFGHVINLVVKAILSQFGQKVKSEAIGETDKDISALDDPVDVEDDEEDVDEAREAADDDDIEEGEDQRPELVLTDADIKLGRLTLQKSGTSPTVRAEMSAQAKAAGQKSEVHIRAVRTRWNTVTMVLERALELRPILFQVCDKAEFNKNQGVRLRRFIVDDEDWPILEQLHELLATFLEATLAISQSATPLIHDVIPWIDVMTKHLEDTRDNVDKLPIIRAAARKGYKILQKYYRHTDETPFYRIAMMLHPCYKKRYFVRARWPRDWVEKALSLLHTEWEMRYRNQTDPAAAEDSSSGPSHGANSPRQASEARSGAGSRASAACAARNMLASLTGADELEEEDALEEYLEGPLRTKQTDPLKFWNNALQNGTADPNLARMALDVLSTPATSMDAERAFSRGRLTVSRLRHSLSDQSVRASTVLGSWARYSELVPEADAIELLRRKEKGKGKVVPDSDKAPSNESAGSMDPWEQLLASYVAPHQYPSPTPSPPPVLRAIYMREAREARSVQDNSTVRSKNPQTSDLTHSSLTTVSTAVHNNPALTDTTAEIPSASAHQTPGSTQSRASRQQNKHQDQQLRYLERLLHELVHVSRPLSLSNALEAHTHAPVQNDTESHPLLPHISPPPSKPQNLQKRPRSPEAADWTTESQPKIPRLQISHQSPTLSTIRNPLGNLGLHATPAPTAQDPVQPARIRQSPRPNRAMSQEFSLDQATREWIQHEIADVFTRLRPPTTGRKHAAPRLAPPEYFDGISPDFEQWKSDVQVYVAGLDKDAAISAVLGLIRGTNVNRWKRNLTQDKFVANGNSWNYTDIAAFWAELTTKFRPINYVNDAITALDQIHMGSRRAEDFIDKW